MAKLKIELEVFSEDGTTHDEEGEIVSTGRIEDAIIGRAADKLLNVDVPDEEAEKGYRRTDKLRELLAVKIEAAVAERIQAVTLEEVDKAVREAIAEGWQKTDQWGEPTGKPLTLKQRINEIINAKADGYDREPRIEKWARETIEAALKKEFNAEIDKARVAFKAQIDGVLQAKLREQLAGALGLKA